MKAGSSVGRSAAKAGTSVGRSAAKGVGKTLILSEHAIKRMAERDITEKMIETTIRKGEKFWDPIDKTIISYIRGGSAKGHDFLVASSPSNINRIVTVNKGRRIFNKRWVPIK